MIITVDTDKLIKNKLIKYSVLCGIYIYVCHRGYKYGFEHGRISYLNSQGIF